MSAFSEIVTTRAGHVIRALTMLLLFTEIYVDIEAFRIKRGAPFRVLACVQTGLGLLFFSALLDGTFEETYLPIERTYPFFVRFIFGAPWAVAALILLILIAACAILLYSNRVFKRTHIFEDAIKQTVDLLPEGVCFEDGEGEAVFFNIRMDEWCAALTGEALRSAAKLREYAVEHGERSGGSSIVTTREGTVLLFGFKDVSVGERDYTQITAFDISERYRITRELRENNAELMDIRRRMREFSEGAAELAMNEELLKARVAVHDELGHVLLRIKYYLDSPDTTDEGKLIAMIRAVNDLLISDAENDDPGSEEGTLSAVADAVEAAGSIGVRTEISGRIPDDAGARAILACAIRECAVNAVKHAGGTLLRVDIEKLPDGTAASFTNDGAPPSSAIIESGGLASLRRMTENARGSMTVESSPVFRLRIVLSEK